MTAVGRYRLAAGTVGVALVALVAIAVPLQLAADDPTWVHVLGPIHGFLYLGYLGTVFDLNRGGRLSGRQLLAMIGAGLVPFLTFVVEHRIVSSLNSPDRVPRGV